MRILLLGAASAAALLAPSAASADTAGYLDLSAGQTSIEDIDLDAISISGAGAAYLGGNWRVQVDGSVDRVSDGDFAFTMHNLAAHAYTVNGDWAWGAVLRQRDMGFITDYTLGVEGQATFGQIVIEGGAGFGTLEAFGDSATSTSVNGDVSWYASSNVSLNAGVNYYDSDDAFGTIVSYNVGGEYQFGGSNSVFAGYTWVNYDDIDADGDGWRIGLRHAFGSDSLQDRRQSGPRWLPQHEDLALFALGPSDRRLKRDIAWVGVTSNGINIYTFRYKWSDTAYVGVMAQELLTDARFRHAVVRQPNGFFAVNYAKLGLRMTTLDRWQVYGLESVLWSDPVEYRRAA